MLAEQVHLNICSAVLSGSSAAGCGKSIRWRGGDTQGPIRENSGASTAVWGVISATVRKQGWYDNQGQQHDFKQVIVCQFSGSYLFWGVLVENSTLKWRQGVLINAWAQVPSHITIEITYKYVTWLRYILCHSLPKQMHSPPARSSKDRTAFVKKRQLESKI